MVICPSCSDEISESSFVRAYYSDISNKEYKLYHCKSCDLEFWVPLEFVKEIYEEEKIPGYEVFHTSPKENLIYYYRYFLNKIIRNLDLSINSKILEIGFGDGSFLKSLEELGFEVYGIEIDKRSVESAKSNLGLKNLYNMSLDEFVDKCIEEGVRFDLVFFFEVLEHQTNPRDFLEKARKILKDGGYIAGTVPNRNRPFAELTRKGRTYDFPPHHFLWFDKESLQNLFKHAKLSYIQIKYLYPDVYHFYTLISDLMYDKTKINLFNRNLFSNNKTLVSFRISRSIVKFLMYVVSLAGNTIYRFGKGEKIFFLCKDED